MTNDGAFLLPGDVEALIMVTRLRSERESWRRTLADVRALPEAIPARRIQR